MLEHGSTQVALWRFPHDPFLPGLPTAVDRDRVREVLDTFGAAEGTPVLSIRSYRAERRAVVEARVGRQRLFLKVVRPNAAETLHRVQAAFAAQLPVPPSLLTLLFRHGQPPVRAVSDEATEKAFGGVPGMSTVFRRPRGGSETSSPPDVAPACITTAHRAATPTTATDSPSGRKTYALIADLATRLAAARPGFGTLAGI